MATRKSEGGLENEFRFVVSGIQLSKAQQQRMADAIARAGAEALADLDLPQPVSAVHFIPREWLGRYLRLLRETGLERQVAQVTGVEQQLVR